MTKSLIESTGFNANASVSEGFKADPKDKEEKDPAANKVLLKTRSTSHIPTGMKEKK